MTRRRWAVVVIALAVVIVVVIAVRGTGGSSDGTATDRASTPTATPTASDSASLSPVTEIAPVTTESAVPGATASSGLPGLGTGSAKAKPGAVSSAASLQGGLVVGYPKRFAPVINGSVIRSSSVSPSKGRLQVALAAAIRAKPDDVLRFYAIRLARLGFTSSPAPAVGGSAATSYKRGNDSVVVTVVTTGGSLHDYTVFATLVTAKS